MQRSHTVRSKAVVEHRCTFTHCAISIRRAKLPAAGAQSTTNKHSEILYTSRTSTSHHKRGETRAKRTYHAASTTETREIFSLTTPSPPREISEGSGPTGCKPERTRSRRSAWAHAALRTGRATQRSPRGRPTRPRGGGAGGRGGAGSAKRAQAVPHGLPGEEDAAWGAHLGVVALEEDGRAPVADHRVPADHLAPRGRGERGERG